MLLPFEPVRPGSSPAWPSLTWPSSWLYNLLKSVVLQDIRALLSLFFSFVEDCSRISRSPAGTEGPAAHWSSAPCPYAHLFPPSSIFHPALLGSHNQKPTPSNNNRVVIFCFLSEQIHYGCWLAQFVKRLFHGDNRANKASDPFTIHDALIIMCNLSPCVFSGETYCWPISPKSWKLQPS